MFDQIKTEIYAWVAACLPGYAIQWAQQDAPALEAPCAILQIENVEARGEGATVVENPDAVPGAGEDLLEQVEAVIRFELKIEVYGAEHSSKHTLDVAQFRVRATSETIDDLLTIAKCTDISTIANIAELLDSAAYESRSELTCVFYFKALYESALPQIATVEATYS